MCELFNLNPKLCNTFYFKGIHLCNLNDQLKSEYKKTFHLLAFLTLIASLLFTSCGPSKKLVESRSRADKLQKDSANTYGQLNECNTSVKNLNEDIASLQTKNSAIQNDLKALNSESKMTIAEQAKRLQNLQNLIQLQKYVMNKLKP